MTPPTTPRIPTFKVGDRQWPAIALTGLLLILYGPLLYHWVDGWLNKSISIEHEYFSHGLLGLPFAAYIAWEKRPQWCQLPDQANGAGFALILVGIIAYFSGMVDAINLSFPIVFTGLCLWLKGPAGLRLLSFPLLLVLLATPNEIPYLIAPYALPLQRFIAGVAAFLLFQARINVEVADIYLYVNGQTVEVAPHCAGLKMLFTSVYVGLMLVYWSGVMRYRRVVLPFLCGTVAISVAANILRNTLLTYFHGTGQDGAFTWLHDSWGGDLYSALMLGSMVPLLQLLEWWFVPQPLTQQGAEAQAVRPEQEESGD
ncbi:MAG: cyanoexosortase B [Leptolyngbyaceae bacterium]|nr:cyanoexosortase B [Leptolyngbyaceae bacterium]